MPVSFEEPREVGVESDQPDLTKQASMKDCLAKIAARQTTMGDVEEKIQKLINEMETSGSQSTVLKNLVREEVSQRNEATKWRKLAFVGACVSLVLLASVFGLMVLSLQLAKELYLAKDVDGNRPMMTDNTDAIVGTSDAKRLYSLSLASTLPEHMLNTITEITFTDPWEEKRSIDIVERYKKLDGVGFISARGQRLFVYTNGAAKYIGDDGIEYWICGLSKCAAFSANDPTEQDLKHEMTRRLMRERRLAGHNDSDAYASELDGQLATFFQHEMFEQNQEVLCVVPDFPPVPPEGDAHTYQAEGDAHNAAMFSPTPGAAHLQPVECTCCAHCGN